MNRSSSSTKFACEETFLVDCLKELNTIKQKMRRNAILSLNFFAIFTQLTNLVCGHSLIFTS